MSLKAYNEKRDFRVSKEPKGKKKKDSKKGVLRFVVQKHDASNLHYDFRLEWDGVLKSWAVPKGPSLDPSDKRLAIQVEDHPLDYADFEGVIPEDAYGGGTVLVWDRGIYTPDRDVDEALDDGELKFTLKGKKLKGKWVLVQMKKRGEKNWLLIKEKDSHSAPNTNILEEQPDSVISGYGLEEIAEVEEEDEDNAEVQELEGARPSSMPKRPAPQLATLVSTAPKGGQWLHEVKYDGYRQPALCRDGEVTLPTRRAQDWTNRFRAVREKLERMGLHGSVLDGEVVEIYAKGALCHGTIKSRLPGCRCPIRKKCCIRSKGRRNGRLRSFTWKLPIGCSRTWWIGR